MNIRASPRKGLSKNIEEVNALKLKKSLFVVKPKEKINISEIGCNTDAKGLFHEDDKVGNQTKPQDNVAATDVLCSTVAAMHAKEVSQGAPTLIEAPLISHKESVSCAPLIENISSDVGWGTTTNLNLCPTFAIGYHNPQIKKPMKFKKKRNEEAIFVVFDVHRMTNKESQLVQADWSVKGRLGTWILLWTTVSL